MKERDKIYQKFVRVGHFIFDILEKPDSFSRQKLYLENEKPPFWKSEKGSQKIKLLTRLGGPNTNWYPYLRTG